MPFAIVRNDIALMEADAIVNTANPRPVVGAGTDSAVHAAAGPELLAARQRIGDLAVGEAAVTPGFGLKARYVIHAVGPVWQGGAAGEEALLRRCYDRALALAAKKKCASVAFPLLSAGTYGFPRDRALRVAEAAFRDFLKDHEMMIWLVVFDKGSFLLSEVLFRSVESFLDETYVEEQLRTEYPLPDSDLRRRTEGRENLSAALEDSAIPDNGGWIMADKAPPAAPAPEIPRPAARKKGLLSGLGRRGSREDLEKWLGRVEKGFSETLLDLIDASGEKDSAVYKRANVDRKLFSKIRNNRDYRPSKTTAVAFAFALGLDLDQTRDLLARAGYALSHSSRFDIIVEYFLLRREYDLFLVNEVLFAFDQPLIGA